MNKKSEPKKTKIDSTISLNAIVKAIFDDTIHVQIGGKIITLPTRDLNLIK